MTNFIFKVQDESGNNLAGISIKGTVTWYFLTLTAGTTPFDVTTNSDGVANFDAPNGLDSATMTYTASGAGYQTITGTVQAGALGGIGAADNQQVNITMQTTSGSGSVPQAHSSFWDSVVAFFKGLSGWAFWVIVIVAIVIILVIIFLLVSRGSLGGVSTAISGAMSSAKEKVSAGVEKAKEKATEAKEKASSILHGSESE